MPGNVSGIRQFLQYFMRVSMCVGFGKVLTKNNIKATLAHVYLKRGRGSGKDSLGIGKIYAKVFSPNLP
jgi:hypothetical protein